jgi:muramoyltetrapeptide carboxypeptidase
MRLPDSLKNGDKVAIVCSARFVEVTQLQEAIELLKSWGLQVVLGRSIGKKDQQFGGTDSERAEDLQQQLDDTEIKAIWIAKGGYGTARILDKLNFDFYEKHPKWIIGYSDITVLHLKLQQLGIASLHADMPVDICSKSQNTRLSLQQSLFGKTYHINYISNFKNQTGLAEGELVGGNLSVLYSVLGTEDLPNFKNKILFIEDLDEYLYHIDRMLLNLSRNGILSKIRGLIVGGMSSMHDNSIPFGKSAYEIVEFYTQNLDIPVAFDFPAGHLNENLALTLGRNVRLEVEGKAVNLQYL